MRKIITLSALGLTLTAFAAEPLKEYQLLSARRDSIKLPEYSVQQKKLVLTQTRLILEDVFAHRDLKIKAFGERVNPSPLLDNIEKNITQISDHDFHFQILDIFIRQRDFHTMYYLPRPFSCYRSFIPVSFKEVKSIQGKKIIAVSAVVDKQEVLDLMPPEFNIEVGDEVISYDGIPVFAAVEKNYSRSYGANAPALRSHAIDLLTFISHNYELLPVKNETTLILKNRLGQTYSLKIPWVSRANLTCLNTDEKPEIVTTSGANDYQLEINRLFRKKTNQKSQEDGDGLKTTAEPILKYKKINNEFGKFGYLKMESFVPEKLSIDGVVGEVKKLLQNEFAKTDGLIFDLRDNGGGLIELADKLPQLFSPGQTTPINFRLKNSAGNVFYMENSSPRDPFTIALREAQQAGLPYTKDMPLYPADFVNLEGQYYFKPVALFTNSSCYSSCDMFSAQMQDHKAAIIFGEESTTGAGGANNYNSNSIFSDLPENNKGQFQMLPSGQNIGFSFRQTVRVAASNGVLLENTGVLSNQISDPSLADLYNRNEQQLKLISSFLNRRSGNYRSWVKIDDEKQDIGLNQLPELLMKWEQTTNIEFRQKGNLLGSLSLEADNTVGRKISPPAGIANTQYKKASFEILGFNGENRVWRKVINYRVIPELFELIVNNEAAIDLNSLPSFMGLYREHTTVENGWQLQNNSLVIGNGTRYESDTLAEASMFFQLPLIAITFSFDAELVTEKDYDFLTLFAVCEGKEVVLEKLSGEIPMKTYEYNLTPFFGRKCELKFSFTSDGGLNFKGVTLKNLKFRRLQ